ncbi:MAG: DUF1501 domain-containing protein [Planctomycetaceae bacterium]|nr:DUF1501 domain-containing protein [Planctomycetaceae bacterium]
MTYLPQHPGFTRRTALQAGSIGLLGLGMNHVSALRAHAAEAGSVPAVKSVIYIFLSGGLAQHESFDMKPTAPDTIRGEFVPISTATAGLQICEHLPMLAQRSNKWSLLRSLTHPYQEHSQGHMVMLSGRTQLPPTFNASKPTPLDWPSIAAIAGDRTQPRNNLPPAVILPEHLIHRTGRVIPGQLAGIMGDRRNPWIIGASPFNSTTYGAFPEYEFHHGRGPEKKEGLDFQAPNLSLPQGLARPRLDSRLDLLTTLEHQRRRMEVAATEVQFDTHREAAISLLNDPKVRTAFDVRSSPAEVLQRYGDNSFGWSLLMARRLVSAGVNLVQVNLGNNETWDTHGNAFPNLKDLLLPPMDRAVSALLDDLEESGELENTLIVMAGEFGRTPKISLLPQHYKGPGRDHWGGAQSVLFAGGGVQGGRVIGSTDADGAYPVTDPHTPEDFAATIYHTLGIPPEAAWYDELSRPHHIYYGQPISGLFG